MVDFPAIGRWLAGQITVSWVASSRPIIPELEAAIERAWATALSRPGIHLFDGPMCRLESLAVEPDALRLTVSRTSYKPFVGTNMFNPRLADRYGSGAMANPVGLSAALLSGDGFVLLGRRNENVAYYPKYVHPFAGCLEPSESVDVFREILRELREELSLADADVEEITCAGVARDRSLGQPELVFLVRVRHGRAKIESQLDAGEHLGIWSSPIDRSAFERALDSGERFTPVGLASLLLLGREQWGDNWFHKRLERYKI